jgi:hypothetical protein
MNNVPTAMPGSGFAAKSGLQGLAGTNGRQGAADFSGNPRNATAMPDVFLWMTFC